MTSTSTQLAQDILDELLRSLGLSDYEITQDQLESQPMLAIAAPDHGRLIGRHGENLQALQTLFNALLRHRDPSLDYVTLDVANYKKDQMEKIMRLAEDSAKKVIDYGIPVELRPMNPYERRIVHMVLADKPELETESRGEDPDRRVIIKTKSS